MHVWDYDITTLGRGEDAELWKLQRQVLYGLSKNERIDKSTLKRLLPKLRGVSPDRLHFLELLIAA